MSTEITMERDTAIEIAQQAGHSANLLDTDIDAVVRWLWTVDRVARGSVRSGDCVCPARGAGLWPEDEDNADDKVWNKVWRFAMAWDELTVTRSPTEPWAEVLVLT